MRRLLCLSGTHEWAGKGEVNAVVFIKAGFSRRVSRVSTTDCVAMLAETGFEAAADLSEVRSVTSSTRSWAVCSLDVCPN